MLKKISIVGVVSTVLLLSGCASKPQISLINGGKTGSQQASVKVRNGSGSPSWAYNESKAFRNVLEAAATSTLKKGYKYFAIFTPDEISNIKGSLANTAEELFAKCDPSSALFISVSGAGGLHKCGTYNTNANLKIIMFNEEQEKHTVIDAQKVIDYLKANDLYDDNGVEIK